MAPGPVRSTFLEATIGDSRTGELHSSDIAGALLSDQLLISIIDDDRPFRESMRRLMRSLHYTVDVFPSAADFLASPRFSETACVIADVQMPAMTGLELFRHLNQLGQPIPTILVTAYPREVDRASALNEGVVCYLRKPVDEQNLSRCLRAALAPRSSA